MQHPPSPIPETSSVNLPPLTRGTVRAAARSGARDAEDLREFVIAQQRKKVGGPIPPRHRASKKDDVPTVEIPRTEHALLIEIACLAQEFIPLLETCGAPVKRPREYEMLTEALDAFRRVRSGNNLSAAETDAVLGLMNIERLLAD
jgi:hypothetical protein